MKVIRKNAEEVKRQLALRLRETRKCSGKPLKKICAEAGITGATLFNIERGTSLPSLPLILLLAKSLGVTVDYLCGDDAEGGGVA